MLTQRNFVSNVKASMQALPVGPNDRALSALPTLTSSAHGGALPVPAAGVSIAIAGSIDTNHRDLEESTPRSQTMVPRYYERCTRGEESAAAGSPLSEGSSSGRSRRKRARSIDCDAKTRRWGST
jgi:long-subunit acyl-CoA synthetase (AMP-forming)